MKLDNFNIACITPSQMFAFLDMCFETKSVPNILGNSGVGKSEIIKAWVKSRMERGWFVGTDQFPEGIIDKRTATMQPEDFPGLPKFEKDESGNWRTVLAPPDEWPLADEKLAIFFDEANQGRPQVLGCLYKITSDRAIGNHKLSDDAFIIMAGNFASDKGIVNPMPAPLVNRCITVRLVDNLHDGIAHFESINMATWNDNSIHVINFLKMRGESNDGVNLFHTFQAETAQGREIFATPRSWERQASLMAYRDVDHFNAITHGNLGESASTEFLAYLDIQKQINPEIFAKILDGESPEFPDNIAQRYIICGWMFSTFKKAVDNPEMDKRAVCDSMMAYALTIPPEYSTIVVSNMEALDKMVVTHSDHFVKYAEHVHCEL